MFEAAVEIVRFGFKDLNLRRIDVEADTNNDASNGLIKKLGFKYEGCLRKAMRCKATGKIHDENLWGLLRSEWKKRK